MGGNKTLKGSTQRHYKYEDTNTGIYWQNILLDEYTKIQKEIQRTIRGNYNSGG